MTLVLRIIAAEIRYTWRTVVLIAAFIVAGIAGVITIKTVSTAVGTAIWIEARNLLGADLVVQSGHPLTTLPKSYLARMSNRLVDEMVSRAAAANFDKSENAYIELHAVSAGFPLFLPRDSSDQTGWTNIQRKAAVMVEPALLERMRLRVGDQIEIGQRMFRIEGTTTALFGYVPSLAPRQLKAYVSQQFFDSEKRGATAFHRYHYELRSGMDAAVVAAELTDRFGESVGKVESIASIREIYAGVIGVTDQFLKLICMVSLLLGMLGISVSFAMFVKERSEMILVLHSLGATRSQIVGIFGVFVLVIGLCSGIAGAGAGLVGSVHIVGFLHQNYGLPAQSIPFRPVLAYGMGLGMVLAVVAALLPLEGLIKQIGSGYAVDVRARWWAPVSFSRQRHKFGICAFWALLTYIYTYVLVQNAGLALRFLVLLAVGTAALLGYGWIMTIVGRSSYLRGLPFVFRFALAGLSSSRSQSPAMAASLGMGIFLMITVGLMQSSLIGRMGGGTKIGAQPNVILADVRAGENDKLAGILKKHHAQQIGVIPLFTAKLIEVRTPKGNLHSANEKLAGLLFAATAIDEIPDYEFAIKGDYHSGNDRAEAALPVALHESAFGELLAPGDRVVWEVEGVRLETSVGAMRASRSWQSAGMVPILFPASVFVNAVRGAAMWAAIDTPRDRALAQEAISDAFPTVTFVDLSLEVAAFTALYQRVGAAAGLVAALTLITGFMLFGALLLAKWIERRREISILRILGMSWKSVLHIHLIEQSVMLVGATATALLVAIEGNRYSSGPILHAPPAEFALSEGLLILGTSFMIAVFAAIMLLAASERSDWTANSTSR